MLFIDFFKHPTICVIPERYRRKIKRVPCEYDHLPGKCWEWQGEINFKGYGRVWFRNERYSVHRLAYVFVHGDLKPEEQVDHLCHNTACCNPRHLEAVTNLENQHRKKANGEWSSKQENYEMFKNQPDEPPADYYDYLKEGEEDEK